jgi:3-methyladenine DNA glycosylase AlkC
MAEPLKNRFGPEVPKRLAATIVEVHPQFDRRGFIAAALDGYAALELMPRARHIATALQLFLPEDYAQAGEILIASLASKPAQSANNSMTPFFYLPHVLFVGQFGLDHFELSMRAQYELTQRFTAEFSIRPFLIHHPQRTLKRLREWSADPNVHVRRLVSEGTRPRLPWAMRLPAFQRDPRPVIALLERLKDDPEQYVRRSVANNLNDIGKDNPAILIATAARWLKNASAPRAALLRHALRSSIKAGDQRALALLGFGAKAEVALRGVSIAPQRVRIGGDIRIAFDILNTSKRTQRLLVDLKVHYAKANGKTAAKVFKLRRVELAPRAVASFAKSLSLADLTTRKHHAGRHRVEALLNGRTVALGQFDLTAAAKKPARRKA